MSNIITPSASNILCITITKSASNILCITITQSASNILCITITQSASNIYSCLHYLMCLLVIYLCIAHHQLTSQRLSHQNVQYRCHHQRKTRLYNQFYACVTTTVWNHKHSQFHSVARQHYNHRGKL